MKDTRTVLFKNVGSSRYTSLSLQTFCNNAGTKYKIVRIARFIFLRAVLVRIPSLLGCGAASWVIDFRRFEGTSPVSIQDQSKSIIQR
jgi:hypothetical protein